MAFDQSTRGRLQKLVNSCRGMLSDEFSIQLQQTYGLDPKTGEVTPMARLTHLDDRQRHTAEVLRQTLAHYLGADADDTDHRITVLDRMVREQAFTVLNRLAALLMMEARGQLIDSVSKGYQSRGYQLYSKIAGTALGETGQAYQVYLFSVFDELSQELPALFDRYAANGLLFPRETAVRALLDELNHFEIEPLWAADETIGWIYQYFNSKDERKSMRDASQAPRNSRELAVRNQFFTPRYVVEFLVDNTLGRLWFSATGGQTDLRERCQYLLVKPDEQPQAALKLRDPRTLKLLDPACGSMHFGLYAFDLFEKIYREAWAWEQQHGPGSLDVSTHLQAALKPLSQTYEDEAAFARDVPRLIIENNIYGVDIDPRAAQIATLALWLRAQRAWHDASVTAKDRPRIGQGHVVAAVAPPVESELRQQFAANLDQRDAELFEKTLQLLKGLPELGVLLQVERELPNLIRQVYVGKGTGLFAAQDQENWQQAEARLRTALTEFAQVAKSTYQGSLFARDALQGLRLIDLCSEVFDVVVMNPPFGAPSAGSKEYIFSEYPDSKYDLFAVFVRRSFELLSKSGFIGAITNRTAFAVESLTQWRKDLFLSEGRLACAIDLGYGVLDDAMVEAAAYVMTRNQMQRDFLVMSALDAADKQASIQDAIQRSSITENLYQHSHDVFIDIPGAPIAYFVSRALIERIRALPEIRLSNFETRSGLQTCDDFRFLRLMWEIRGGIGDDQQSWVFLSKGGEYQPLIPTLHLLANWANNGAEMKAYAESLYQQWSRTIQSIDFQLKKGITFSERTTSDLSLRILPENCLFTKTGPGIFSASDTQMMALMAVSYSRLFRLCCELYIGSGDESVSGTAARHYRPALIGRFPMLVNSENQNDLESLFVEALSLWSRLSARWETSPFFCGIGELNFSEGFSGAVAVVTKERLDCLAGLAKIQGEIEELSHNAAGLSHDDLHSLDETIGPSPHTYDDAPNDAQFNVKVEQLWSQDESALVEIAKQVRGARRQLVKMSYFSDRKLELVAHICQSNPASIAKGLAQRLVVTPGDIANFAEDFASYLIGASFKRWSTEDYLTLESGVVERPPFSSLSTTPPCFNTESAPTPDAILVNQKDHSKSLERVIQLIIGEKFGAAADLVEQEMASALNAKSLIDYFNSPSGFFAAHLRRYSESRRQAPIYWPLSTTSGSYTLWIYYPSLNNQTLFTAVNDFLDGPNGKLTKVSRDCAELRIRGGGRSRDEEKQYETMRTLEQELFELRDTLLKIASTYQPNHDDGVQITAAPLWPLFCHKPWQKVLKDTWAKLEKGEYDWAHLAMAYWPERLRVKCKTDKSLAIAHGLEDLYVEPEAAPKKTRVKKKAGANE
jgi:hypothetical protein